MAQFIALMRVQESQQDEEIYWQTHPWSRFKRNRKEWYAKKMEEYNKRSTLGGSRLSANEQAELEGRTLDDIRREIEGLGDDDDGEEEGEGGSTPMNYVSEGVSSRSEFESGKASSKYSDMGEEEEA